jgi:hypothetical protein
VSGSHTALISRIEILVKIQPATHGLLEATEDIVMPIANGVKLA